MGYKIRGRGAAICVLAAALWLGLGAVSGIASAAPQDPHMELLEIAAQAAAEANAVAADFAAFAATKPTQAQLDKAYAEAQEDLAQIEADALENIADVVANHPGNLTVQNAALVATGVVTGAVDEASDSVRHTLETAVVSAPTTTIPTVITTTVPTTVPSVSTTIPTVSTTIPTVSTTSTTVPTAIPTVSTTSTTVAAVTATSTTTVPGTRATDSTTTTTSTTVPALAGGASPESPAGLPGPNGTEEDPGTAASASDDSATSNPLGAAPATQSAASLSLAIDVAAGDPVRAETGLADVSFDRLDSFLRTAIPSGISEPIIDGFTLLRTIGLAFMSGVQAISWPVLALAFTSFLLYDRRTTRSQI